MGQHLGVVEQCDEAIRALFRAQARVSCVPYEKLIGARADGDAAYLAANGAKGIYYGRPGTRVRLCFSGEKFYLGGDVLEYEEYLVIQEATAREFAVAGLAFHRMLEDRIQRHVVCPAIQFAQAI